ncbi:non-ribosomal peptide synthetase [Bacillus sp. BP-3]|uniref:non-ribosomal peptide synthetase n=1 Tax=Bacillus sp. BP-3 TaxID=3022773 RepID=UPI00232DFD6B|nr:amino acid adenylation domain-containing protein [Bacillus sp. BP-3]MDC2865509.1 amino acid adenylation domain-containing protein [Bacillus sp. BP-3]
MSKLPVENEVYMLPASYGQTRMWFFEQMFSNSATYAIPFIFKIKGALNKKALEQTLQKIINRHEVLRTTFYENDGEILQKISVSVPDFNLEMIKREGIEQVQPLESYLKEFSKETFDLVKGPLIKFKLIQLGEEYHYLLVNVHHSIFDAWSINILEKEILKIYPYFDKELNFDWEELPLQYADYAVWQKKSFEGLNLEEGLNFWRNYLQHAPLVLDLPIDRARPKEPSYQGDNYKFAFPKNLSNDIQEFCRTNNTTYYAFFLSVFNILLYRYSGQKDIVVGTPITNRKDKQIQELIGFFVNTLPIRTVIQSNKSFRMVLQDTVESFLQAHENGDVPFEKIVQEVSPERDKSYHPIFQVLFTLHENKEEKLSQQLLIEHEKINTSTSKFDFVLYISCETDNMTGEIEYSTDLFDKVSIDRIFENYVSCIQAVLKSPDESISAINMLTEEEKSELVIEESGNLDCSRFVHHLFEKEAANYANKTAIKGTKYSFSYKELNERANQVANELQKQGVQSGDVIGICLKRSPEQIATIIGVLKCGCAYLPIDPALPKERIRLIVDDSGTKMIITDGIDLAGILDVSFLSLNAIFRDGSTECIKWVPYQHPKEHLAYVIYTSGSTGKPKGIGITHASLLNHIQGMLQVFPMGDDERVLQNITYSFDASVTEIFSTFLGGGTLILTHPDRQFDIEYLAELMINESVTRAQLFHSLIEKLIDLSSFTEKNNLRYVFTGGEALSNQLVRLFHEKMGEKVSFVNLYGPTEATVASTYWISEPNCNQNSAPIGSALPGYHLLVLNEDLQHVPRGGVGELFIGGKGVAPGYFNNKRLNQSNFISINSNGISNLYYRTGDLVKQLANGQFVFLTRKDSQVKVRGFRIELDEIKNELLKQTEIENAVVITKEIKGDKKIFAFIIRAEGADISANNVKERLENTLPHYMIPKVISWIDKVPITLNGKVDQQKLPFERNDLTNKEKIFAKNLLERQLADIWGEALNLTSVGINEDFFDLGGHSIKAIEVMGLIRKKLNLHIPLSCLFEYKTIKELSEYIKEGGYSGGTVLTLPLKQTTSSEPPLFLIHPGGGGALCYVPLAKGITKNINIFGIQSQGYETNKEPLTSIFSMAKLYTGEILKIQSKGPYRLAGWSMGGTLAVEIARLLEERGENISFIGLIDAHPFDQSMKRLDREEPLVVWAYSLGIQANELYNKSEIEKYQIVLGAAKEKGVIPRSAELEDAKQIIKVMAANNMASDQYEFGEPIQSNLVLLNCKEIDSRYSHELVDVECWKNRTKGKVYVYPIKGKHNNLMLSPQVEYISEIITNVLEGREGICRHK